MSNLVVFQQIHYTGNEVFDITNPRYNEPIGPVPWHFVKSRFQCSSTIRKLVLKFCSILFFIFQFFSFTPHYTKMARKSGLVMAKIQAKSQVWQVTNGKTNEMSGDILLD